jgi:hypothetical protein
MDIVKIKELKTMITEQQLKDVLMGVWETEFKDEQPFEEFADGYDFWIDKDGDILFEGRGMKPLDGVKMVGHVDNNIFWVY